MWKCVGLMLLLGQFIVLTSQQRLSEDETQRHTRKAGECCPCSDNPGSDAIPSESEHLHTVDCPCKSQSADLESASSMFSPVLSAVKPLARQFDKKTDPKPLLEPEVDLASSVLETLQEVTEEEYQDAVARDAARSAIQSAYPIESSTNLVTVVVSPDARENIDDVLPEASNNQERKCILPGYEDYAFDGTSFNPLQRNGMWNDMNDAPSNVISNFQTPTQLQSPDTPLRNLFRNVPVAWARHTPSLKHENRAFYIPTNTRNNIFRKPFVHLDPITLFSARKPLDIANLLNLRDVELIPAKKVMIARGQTRPESIASKMFSPANNINRDLSNLQLLNSPVTHLDTESDCNWDGTELNPNIENGDKNVHTEILNTVPTAPESLFYNEKNMKPQNNIHLGNKLVNEHKNFDAQKADIVNCINDKDYEHNTLLLPKTKIVTSEKVDLNKNHNNINHLLSPEASNNLQVFQRSPNSPEVTEDFKLNDLNIHDRLRFVEADASQNAQNKPITEVCTLGNEMNPGKYIEKGRSNNADYNDLSMKNLQKMSNSMLFGHNKDGLDTIDTAYAKNQDNLDTYRTTSDNIAVNIPYRNIHNNYKLTSEQDMRRNSEDFRNDNPPITRTSTAHEKESANTELCYENDKSARTVNNEMKTAASESFNTQYRIDQHSNNFPKNSLFETPLEDINLDIFQYQPPMPNSLRNPESPLFNIKSYKTQLPIPKALDFQPVKLQKAIRRGSDILGATLTMKPHTRKSSLPLLKNGMRSYINQANGLKIPDIDDIRAYLENNLLRGYELPFLSSLACNHLSPLAQQIGDSSNNIKTYAEKALINVPGNLGNTLRESESIDHNLMGEPIFNPSDVIETITEAREDFADKLNTLRLNLDDRIKQFHQSLTGSQGTPSLRAPQQSRVTNTKYNPVSQSINLNRKNIANSPLSPDSNTREARLPGLRPTLNRETLNNKRPLITQENPADLLSQARFNRPITRPDSASKPVGITGLRQADTKKAPSLLERIKLSRESKGIISLTTTKRPPVAPALTKPKPALPRPSTIQSRISQPRTGFPERIGSRRKETMKEPKTSPSEVSCTLGRPPSLSENIGRESTPSGIGQIPRILNKSMKPNISENTFLSKVKDAVLPKNAKISEILPSASEAVRHTEPSNGISFNCKMVCEKS